MTEPHSLYPGAPTIKAQSLATITVRFTREGFHVWPDAPVHRSYLAVRHRHLFYVSVSTRVGNDDREIEFHDLLDYAKQEFRGGELGAQSCESMARKLAMKLSDVFDRDVSVTVSEDNECESTVEVIKRL